MYQKYLYMKYLSRYFLQHKVFMFAHVAWVMGLSFEMLDMGERQPGCCVQRHWEKSSSCRSAPHRVHEAQQNDAKNSAQREINEWC